jgi:hypothetical protein
LDVEEKELERVAMAGNVNSEKDEGELFVYDLLLSCLYLLIWWEYNVYSLPCFCGPAR